MENNKTYYLAVDGKQTGPYTVEQLSQMPLTSQSLVWTQGMPAWKSVGNVPELAHLVANGGATAAATPPRFGNESPTLEVNQEEPVEDLSLWQYFMKCLHNYANFKGRARRKEYWGYTLFYWIFYLILASIVVCMYPAILNPNVSAYVGDDVYGNIPMVPIILLFGYILLMLIPGLAVTSRRLHDTNRSFWWYLINLIPYVGGIVLLVFMCIDGNPYENDYGKDPKGRNTFA